jgi:predicted GTPase
LTNPNEAAEGSRLSPSDTLPLEQGLHVVKQIKTEFRLDSLLPQILALSRSLPDRRVLNVAVVGRFKAGKSSFLNDLIGREVLPVDVLPATSVITQVSYRSSRQQKSPA